MLTKCKLHLIGLSLIPRIDDVKFTAQEHNQVEIPNKIFHSYLTNQQACR